MAFGIHARRFAALARVHGTGNLRLPIDHPAPAGESIDPWLDTLEALARKRVEQREELAAEARLRIAIRARRDE